MPARYLQVLISLRTARPTNNAKQVELFSRSTRLWQIVIAAEWLRSITELVSPFEAVSGVAPNACAINYILFMGTAAASVENNVDLF